MVVIKSPSVSSPRILSGTSVVRRRPLQCLVWTLLFILYVHYINCRPPPILTAPAPAPSLDEIPHKLWQIFFDDSPIDLYTDAMQSWITKNQDYQYTLVSAAGANAFAFKHYADRMDILYPFLSLRVPELRANLLRYMILESEGGVYSDLDTAALRPATEWIAPGMRSKVHAVVGLEYHQREDEEEEEADPGSENPRLQFCQWTLAASRGHPLMSRMVTDTAGALRALATESNTSIGELSPGDEGVIEFGGPERWTKAVLKTLSEATGTEVSYRNFTRMLWPKVFGDVMVLPVSAFGTGRLRSGGLRDDFEDVFVRRGEKET